MQPSLVYCPHPLLPAAGRELHYVPFLPGESVGAYLDRLGIHFGAQPVILCINGHAVLREAWGTVLPREGDLITVRARVQGGGGGKKNPIVTILAIAVMIFAPHAAVALGPSLGIAAGTVGSLTLAGTLLSGVISIAGNLLINALFSPPQSNLSNAQNGQGSDSASPTYSLSGGSNRARPYEPLLLVLGEHRVFADYGAKFYTEFDGDDQYLYQVFHFGISVADFSLVLSDFRIGNTPLADFAGVETQVSDNSGALTLFPANVDAVTGGALTYAASWINKTSATDTTALAFEISGSVYTVGTGGISVAAATIQIQYRVVGAPTWETLLSTAEAEQWIADIGVVPADEIAIASASRKPVRRTYRVTVARNQYETRVRRTSAEYTDPANTAEIAWTQLRSYQPDDADYTGQKRVALRIKASGQLQGQVEQFNALATRHTRVWNGSAWVTAATCNPAWLMLAVMRGGYRDSRRTWGCGLADARINLANLIEYGAWCDANTLSFDGVIDQRMNCLDLLNAIARCGRGSTSLASGQYGVVWDAAAQPVVQMFGLGNILSGTFSVKWVSEKLGDEIVMNYWNKDKDWQQDTVRALVPGVTDPVNPVTVELFGCVNSDQAGREANLIAAAQKYRRRFVTFESDFEGQVVTRGDVVALSHDLFAAQTINAWGYSGRLVSGTTTVLQLDRAITMSNAATNYCGVRYPDGTMHVKAVTYAGGEVSTITLASALPSAPDADSLNPAVDYIWLFGLDAAGAAKKFKVHECAPLSDKDVRLVLVDENPAYYAAEDGDYTPSTPTLTPVQMPDITSIAFAEEFVQAGNGLVVKLAVSWEVTGVYDHANVRAWVGEELMANTSTPGRRIDITVPGRGTARVEIVPVHPVFGAGTAALAQHTIALMAALPPDLKWLVADEGESTSGPVNIYDPSAAAAVQAQSAAESALRLLLKVDELKTRSVFEKWVTDATVTVDPDTGTVTLLATAEITTDVEEHLRQVDITLGAIDATVTIHTSVLDTLDGRVTDAEASIAVLEGAIALTATTSYVDGELAAALGIVDPEAIAAASQASAEGLLHALLDAETAHVGVVGSVARLAVAETTLRTHADALTAEAVARTVVAAQVDTNLAATAVQLSALATVDAALATSIALVEAASDANTAAITTEQTARASGDSALSSSISTVSAAVTSEASTRASGDATNAAAITTEATARASGDSSLATSISSVSARLDSGDFATVKTLGVATADDLGDVTARWGVTVEVMGDGTRAIAGIELLAGTDDESLFAITADKFVFYKPDGTGDPVQVLDLGLVNGATQLSLHGNLVVDGSIITRAIGANSVTIPVSSYVAGPVDGGAGSYATLTSATIAATGYPVLITATLRMNTSGGPGAFEIQIVDDLGAQKYYAYCGSSAAFQLPFSFTTMDTPAATRTYYLKAKAAGAFPWADITLNLMAVKR